MKRKSIILFSITIVLIPMTFYKCELKENKFAYCLLDNFSEGGYYICVDLENKKALVIENIDLYYFCYEEFGWNKEQYIQKLGEIVESKSIWKIPEKLKFKLSNYIISQNLDSRILVNYKSVQLNPLLLNEIKGTKKINENIYNLFTKEVFIYRQDYSGLLKYEKFNFQTCR